MQVDLPEEAASPKPTPAKAPDATISIKKSKAYKQEPVFKRPAGFEGLKKPKPSSQSAATSITSDSDGFVDDLIATARAKRSKKG